MHPRAFPLAVFAAVSLWLPVAADAMVNGSATINGVKYKLTNAYAFQETAKPDSDVILIVADAAIPAALLRDTFGLIHLVEDGKVHGVKLTLKGKQCISGTVLDKETIHGSGVWGKDMVEVDSLENGSIVAHALQGPETMFKNKFEYTFQVVIPIETPKAEAAATPESKKIAEASVQGKLYRDFSKAVKASDIPTLRKLVNKDMASKMNDPKFPEALEFIKSMQATNVELQLLTVDGNNASITAQGKDPDGKPTYGVLTFVKEGADWKVAKESWRNTR